MSCNGCRVLRKGCSENCILRPCLQWIDSPESQGHATVFVAKFFGRAGLTPPDLDEASEAEATCSDMFKLSHHQDPNPKYDCLLFDVDDTLYPLKSGLSAECTKNIIEYMINKLGMEDKAPRNVHSTVQRFHVFSLSLFL
ncbi:unnamed protein product [Camellia sinensis]